MFSCSGFFSSLKKKSYTTCYSCVRFVCLFGWLWFSFGLFYSDLFSSFIREQQRKMEKIYIRQRFSGQRSPFHLLLLFHILLFIVSAVRAVVCASLTLMRMELYTIFIQSERENIEIESKKIDNAWNMLLNRIEFIWNLLLVVVMPLFLLLLLNNK